MILKTEYEFTLPKGYVDENGDIHNTGVMRLATAADEIMPLRDPRVRDCPEYLKVIILSRVIVRLGTLPFIDTGIIEKLYSADLQFLENMYQTINEIGQEKSVTCPHCGKIFLQETEF